MGRFVAVLALACLASACSGDGGASPTTATTGTTVALVLDSMPPITELPPADPADVDRAERAVVALADLPPGWSSTGNTDHRTRIDLPTCAPSAIAMAVAGGDDLVAPDGTIVAQLTAAGDPVVATAAIAELRDAGAAACLTRAARRVVETGIAAVPGTPREVTIGDAVVNEPALSPVGDDLVAQQVSFPITIDGIAADTFVVVVVVRVGGSVAVLTARRPSTPPGLSALDDVTAAVTRRLAGV